MSTLAPDREMPMLVWDYCWYNIFPVEETLLRLRRVRIWHGQNCEPSSMISSRVFSTARRQAVQHRCGLHCASLRRVRTTPSVPTYSSVVYFAGCAALRSARRAQASRGNKNGKTMSFIDSTAHGYVRCIASECGGFPCQRAEHHRSWNFWPQAKSHPGG